MGSAFWRAAACAGCLFGAEARAEQPLSAIDWLSTSVAPPGEKAAPPVARGARPAQPTAGSAGRGGAGAAWSGGDAGAPAAGGAASAAFDGNGALAVLPPMPGETPTSQGVTTESVSVTSLDHPPTNALGLVPVARVGLPPDVWGQTPEQDLAALLRKERPDALPSIRAFLTQILLAELDPPAKAAPEGRDVLFLARIDGLLDIGALEQAMALLEQADPTNPEVFRRRFDVALLLGRENEACEVMRKSAAVAPSFPARIFCLARQGDWSAASVLLQTGTTLGRISTDDADLLARFLEPELAEEGEDLPPPARPSPLTFRLMEAIGEPMSTATLPVAFAQTDLTANNGWKAQIEAAERLTRSGALDPNRLFGLYTRERASASGGVWDRVTAVRQLDAALSDHRDARAAQLLPALWDEMQSQELEPALAAMFADRLQGAALDPQASAIAFRLGLLTPDFARYARGRADQRTAQRADQGGGTDTDETQEDEAFLIAVARGDTSRAGAQDRMGLALKRVFDAPPKAAPAPYAALMPDREGEALLDAIDAVTEGARGDLGRLRDGLSFLRFCGFETVARRAALELLILERNG